MKNNFSIKSFRQAVREAAATPSWTVTRLAKESGVDQASLWRFCDGSSGLSGINIEKLWPFIYGDKRPGGEPKEAA
jgi:hypothetical protein